FNLDVCFFRAYEDGKPVRPSHHFTWSDKGPAEDDLVFVTGHPGTTNRQDTLAMLRHRRDETLPYLLARVRYLEALLAQFSQLGPDEARMAAKDHHRVANARKAFTGQYQGLLDPAVLAAKEKDESAFRRKMLAQKELKDDADAYRRIAAAQKALAGFERLY